METQVNMTADIGLEIHVQLDTRSKMFCACGTDFGAPPNTMVCPVCLGYPGALPVINAEAVRLTVMTGMMLGCRINPKSKFDRKQYFYPDVSKNYQISQYDQPLCSGGALTFALGQESGVALPGGAAAGEAQTKTVRLTRIHLEEDVAKNMHYQETSRVDFNRCGHPLMEIVTEPDLHSPEEAFAFLLALKQILVYGGISPCNLEEGNLRCDINCSVRPVGQRALGVKTEIKNMNTFKGVFQALQFEIARGGGVVCQETRRWLGEEGVTASMRAKEDAHDYRYFPDPDLPPVIITDAQLKTWAATLPELPVQRCERLEKEYGITAYDARVLSADKAVADYFETAARLAASAQPAASAKSVANWMMTEMLRYLSENDLAIERVAVTPAALAELAALVENQTINMPTAKTIFAQLCADGGMPGRIVAAQGLAQISDDKSLTPVVDRVLAEHSKSAEDFRSGKAAALQFLIGQVMRHCKGKANPRLVRELLEKRLS
jgi:aspartyl-tRNA(Asn)/glutamyl-tRNA(Gln) amidotransferase subunit B